MKAQENGLLIDTRDGIEYPTVVIGEQVWMAENLKYDKGNSSSCYRDNPVNCDKYGRLYDWKTANIVCPDGWRLPTKNDFDILLENFGGKGEESYYALIEGGSSGFSAVFGGWRVNKIRYGAIRLNGNYWSSTPDSNNSAWCLTVTSYSNNAILQVTENFGLSVRCLKNTEQ